MVAKPFVNEMFYLNSSIIKKLAKRKPKFDAFGAIVFFRTYSRIIDGVQERWHDVVRRVIEGTMSIRKDWYIKNNIYWDEKKWQKYAGKLAESMFDMKWLPAGRGLWAMGTQFVFDRGSMALNNCGLAKLGGNDRLANDIHWLMDALMLGVGVGFEAIRQPLKFYTPTGTFIHYVQDSREGWCHLIQMLIEAYLMPDRKVPDPRFDLVRGPGQPIKGFGGFSSGPDPLKKLFYQVKEWLENGESIDVVRLKTDIANAVGVCVVAGNVRRSAELAKGSIQDEVFMDLKDYDKYPDREDWGYMSNNSVALFNDDDFERLGEVAKRVVVRGEPGVMNLRNMPLGRVGEPMDGLRPDEADGFNPCQPASAKVLTPKGIRRFDEVTVGDLIWSQNGWTKIVKKWSTGINPVYRYRTTAGCFEGTEGHRVVSNHMKVEARNATSIDSLRGPYEKTIPNQIQAIMDGLVLGDGTQQGNNINLCIGKDDSDYFQSEIASKIYNIADRHNGHYHVETTFTSLPYTYQRQVPDMYLKAERQTVCSFLRGLYSANGSLCGNRITLKASSFEVIEQVQMMLSSVGIRSYYTTNKPTLVKHNNGEYLSKQSYDLNIAEDRQRFAESIGFIQKYKTDALQEMISRLKKKGPIRDTYDIVSIEYMRDEETWDITVDNHTHTYWSQCLNVSNCGEIPLCDKELCNVVETLPTMCKDYKDWLNACEYATFYASTVSLLPTHRHETNQVLVKNRRIGVGIVDWTGWVISESMHRVVKYMREGYKLIRKKNAEFNGEAGVPAAIRVTAIKPGGTTPKLASKTPGIGYPTFCETLRRIRVAANNPICPLLDRAGVPFEPCYNDPQGTRIYAYPTMQGPAPPADQVSLWEQAMNLICVQRHWSDNSVSNTLYFKPKWRLDFMRSYSVDKHDSEYGKLMDEFATLFPEFAEKANLWGKEVTKQKITINGDNYKVTIKANKWNEVEFSFYQFDPDHEEDIIEKVLSMLVPQIKSCSLLPHTAKGAYRQMPEEGLTPVEYAELKAKIKEVDWTDFAGSDGEDQKYCEGPTCMVPI